MTNEQAINIKAGQSIKIYDGCLQCDKTEKVVRVEKSSACYDTVYIYSVRDNELGYDERLSTPNDIKELYT
jgi:hypothetical protein